MELRVSRLTANRNLSASTKTLRFYVFCRLPGKEKRAAAALLRALAAGYIFRQGNVAIQGVSIRSCQARRLANSSWPTWVVPPGS